MPDETEDEVIEEPIIREEVIEEPIIEETIVEEPKKEADPVDEDVLAGVGDAMSAIEGLGIEL